LEVYVGGRRSQRSRPEPGPTAGETTAGNDVPAPLHVTGSDLLDAAVMAAAIFTIFYLGSLAQRMGAH
jgi:hypothetical protein